MGEFVESGDCLVVDSLSKRRALSGLRVGYLLAAAGTVARHAIVAFGGCPPLAGAPVIAAELLKSADLHGKPAATTPAAVRDEHYQYLLEMRSQVQANIDLARAALRDYWVEDTHTAGNFNAVISLRAPSLIGDDAACCRLLFSRLVTSYPLSTFALPSSTEPPVGEGDRFDVRLTCATEPSRFAQVLDRAVAAIESTGPTARATLIRGARGVR
jgi:aspartate/methionine/tyrosine aminotransferase